MCVCVCPPFPYATERRLAAWPISHNPWPPNELFMTVQCIALFAPRVSVLGVVCLVCVCVCLLLRCNILETILIRPNVILLKKIQATTLLRVVKLHTQTATGPLLGHLVILGLGNPQPTDPPACSRKLRETTPSLRLKQSNAANACKNHICGLIIDANEFLRQATLSVFECCRMLFC